jgi:hypothetical protein
MFVWLSFRCLLDLESFRGNGVSASLLIRGYHSVQCYYFLWGLHGHLVIVECLLVVLLIGVVRSDSGVAIASSVSGACTILSRHCCIAVTCKKCIPACCRLRHPDWRRQWGLADQPGVRDTGGGAYPRCRIHGTLCGFGCSDWGDGGPEQDDIDY